MFFALRNGLSFCETSGRLVFLDTIADRYFGLSSECEREFRDFCEGSANGFAAPPGTLVERGLLVPHPGPCAIGPTRGLPDPIGSALDTAMPPLRPWLIAAAAMRFHSTKQLLNRIGLMEALNALGHRKAGLPSCDTGDARALAISAAFERLSVIVSPLDQCLPRSIALTASLAKRGIGADLVLGVRLRPFLAHSWVCCEDWALNERVDVVRTFTPILVI